MSDNFSINYQLQCEIELVARNIQDYFLDSYGMAATTENLEIAVQSYLRSKLEEVTKRDFHYIACLAPKPQANVSLPHFLGQATY